MTRLDVERLLGALDDAGVKYVLIGGLAVVAHAVIRTTEDVDLVPAPDADNLAALGNALTAIDARLTRDQQRTIDPELRLELARGKSISLTTTFGEVDIVQRLPGVPSYVDLEGRALRVEAMGLTLLVASRDDLIAMKRARGSAQDLADIEALEASGES